MTQTAREGRGGEGDFSAGNIFHDVATYTKYYKADIVSNLASLY